MLAKLATMSGRLAQLVALLLVHVIILVLWLGRGAGSVTTTSPLDALCCGGGTLAEGGCVEVVSGHIAQGTLVP